MEDSVIAGFDSDAERADMIGIKTADVLSEKKAKLTQQKKNRSGTS